MPFEVVPAIDVAAGRLVRMSRGEPVPVEAFDGDPLAAAHAYVAAGAARLHVVDVDLAGTGEPGNLATVRSIAAAGVAVQASGGIASDAHADALLEAGADRIVLASMALADRAAAERMIERYGERLCVGIEADGPTIRPRGAPMELSLWETLGWLVPSACARFVFTEVGRVGSLAGPDLDGVWALAEHTRRPVLASGGVRSVEDLLALAALGGTVEGAIVGRALHEGLDLRAAIAAVS